MRNRRHLLARGAFLMLLGAGMRPALAEDVNPFWAEDVGELGHRITSLALRGHNLFVAGQSDYSTGSPYYEESFIAARDAKSGELDWERPIEGEFRHIRVAAHGRRVYAITTGDREGRDDEARVVAFGARDGEILWDDRIPHAERDGTRVFVLPGGQVSVAIAALDLGPPPGANPNLQTDAAEIRAYDSRGARRWKLTLGGSYPDWDFSVRAAVLRGRWLWIAGAVEGDYVVRCYNALDGELAWEDRMTIPTTPGAPDDERLSESADLLALRGRTLVVAGSTHDPHASPHSDDPLVRAYDARSGRVLWTYTSSDDERYEYPQHIAVSGRSAIVAWLRSGNVWSTRLDAFDLRTGAVVAQLPLDAFVSDMGASGEHLVLAGGFHGTAKQPEDGEPYGFVMGVEARGALRPTWEAFLFRPVGALTVARRLAFAGSSYIVAAYDLR